MIQSSNYSVERFGRELEPVIIIDHFSRDLERLVAVGRRARYAAAQGYPGIRSPLDPNYLSAQGALLTEILSAEFDLSGQIGIESCAFSIVTTPPDALAPSQRIPHYDGPEPNLIAIVQYTSQRAGGTAFYRHKRTGFEFVNPARVAEYRAAIGDDDGAFGPPPEGYCYGDSRRYEMIGEIEAKPDRLILYRGRVLHSGVISAPPFADAPLENGRLTVTAFLQG
ncbi:DUF6445 family protein [Erythrobacter sp. W53]|uniref:DUF6445 family protein n=1 Tax=Erythrobacter sp. W53 TaxID=3425947 RepID=UPI003D7683D7